MGPFARSWPGLSTTDLSHVYNSLCFPAMSVAVISLILAIASRGGDDYDDEDDYDDPFEEEHDN